VFFLQEHLKSLGKDKTYQPRNVHVIGAGTMGGDIAAWCALRGFHVSLQDQAPERIAPAIARAHRLFAKKLKKPEQVRAAMDRLKPDHKAQGVERADIIIEAIFEDAEVKRSLYETIEPRMKAGAILATNTSSIPLEELTPVLKQPERLRIISRRMIVGAKRHQRIDYRFGKRSLDLTEHLDCGDERRLRIIVVLQIALDDSEVVQCRGELLAG